MSDSTGDTWSAWLEDQRFSGGEQEQRLKETLWEYREKVLNHAALEHDATVLDVGSGDGLIGFGALERLGTDGEVIFSDVSEAVLNKARTTAKNLAHLDRCDFVLTGTENLALDSESVDAVTLRSVLIFVEEKEQAFSEFDRVLKPGGRLSIYEPIGDFTKEMQFPDDMFMQYEMEHTEHDIPGSVRDFYQKMREYAQRQSPNHDTAMNFDERDLFALAEGVGFEDIHLELHAYHTRYYETENWDSWLSTSFGPGTPTKQEAMEEVLTPEDRETFTENVRPLVESRAPKAARGTPAYLWATKPDDERR